MKRYWITIIAISIFAGGDVSAQNTRGDRNSYLGQHLATQKDTKAVDRLARRKAVQEGLTGLSVQSSKDKMPTPTAEQQKKLKKFVREHHPELIRLLNFLEKNRPEHYETAIKLIADSHNRLMAIQKRDPKRYETALEQWKLRSRIKLTAAQLAIKDSPQRQKQLQQLIQRQFELRAQQLRQEETRIGQRLEKVRSQLERMDKNLDAAVQREMRIAIRQANRLKKGLNAVNKPNNKRKDKPRAETKDNGL